MRKRFGKGRGQLSGEMELQITSMADIFTILLVFLLKSYATGATNLSPSKGLSLPEAHASDQGVEALKIEVSESGVQIEGKPVAALKNYTFDQADLNQNGSSKVVSAAMEIERKRQTLIAQQNADVKVDAKIIVIADQRVPYQTVKTVLASAAVNGYTDFKLAVVRGE